MVYESIQRMAEATGDVTIDSRGRSTFEFDNHGLVRFAELVVAAERERWKAMIEERGQIHGESSRIYSRLASAVRSGTDDIVLGHLLRAEVMNRA